MTGKRKNLFTVKLSYCGNTYIYSSYNKMDDKNAVELIKKAISIMARDMVGSKLMNTLIFTIGLDIIDVLHKRSSEFVDKDELKELKESFTIIES